MTELSRACYVGAAGVVLLASVGCGDGLTSQGGGTTTDPGTTSDPKVNSTNPSSAPAGVTLDVRVLGSGYSQATRAVWALHGDTALTTTRIKTNSTTFVGPTELVANITIEPGAPSVAYDVAVVTIDEDKKGIGLEQFTVLQREVLDLGIGDGSEAMAINDHNQIVGRGGPGSGAFLWENGVVTDLGALPGGRFAQAEDINASGQVAGTSSTVTRECRAVLWTPKAGGGYNPPVDLGTLGGSCSEATAMNDDGAIAGDSKLPGDAVSHAVIWDANRQIHDIQTVQGGESFTWGVNALGQVVGQWNGPTHQQAFRYTPGTGMELLPGLGGAQGVALDINGLGQVVGWSGPSAGASLRATLWDVSSVVDLGTLGGQSSVGFAITDDGQVVGRSETDVFLRDGQQFIAFLWTAGAGMQKLPLPIGTAYAQAEDINSNGWIVGETSPDPGVGAIRATVWRP